ncbi:reverse transcriptase domain-containing protein [Trichonephila clavipes]|nr:reverse transcriptase domain-containing protein [Trichonephila clavipes]
MPWIKAEYFQWHSSAYDTVWTYKLKLKLANLGIENNMFNWYLCFLCHALCKITYGRGFFKHGVPKTGLPQGSLSSGTLFHIYINYLVHQLRMINGVRCLLLADTLAKWTESPMKHAT